MDQTRHRAIAERARQLWREAGSPPGREAEFQARAARELGGEAEAALQRSVDRAVPPREQLRGRAAENPLSQHVAEVAAGERPGPGGSTFEGGEAVEGEGPARP